MDDQDWRLKVWGTVSERTRLPGGGLAEKGSVCKVVSVVNINKKKKTLTIPVPELAALYISSSKRAWDEYREIRFRSKIDSSIKGDVCFTSDEDAFDALERLSLSIVMAYSAIEAFCNDSIPNEHEYWHHKKSQVLVEKSDKDEIERKFSTVDKLNTVLPEIYGVKPPKGKRAWQSYSSLKSVRDGLIHAKSKQTRSVGNVRQNLWDDVFLLCAPYKLAKDVFDWYLAPQKNDLPKWYLKYPK